MVVAAGGTQTRCRIRDGLKLPDYLYNSLTCASCWGYIFQKTKQLQQGRGVYLVAINGSNLFPGTTQLLPDITNDTVKDYICRCLSRDECSRWSKCCRAAIDCCQMQKQNTQHDAAITGNECPATWDGYACWDYASAGTTTYMDCPSFLPFVTPGGKFILSRSRSHRK
jgi:calcitonin receptor-like